jgi:hypothetical protein
LLLVVNFPGLLLVVNFPGLVLFKKLALFSY